MMSCSKLKRALPMAVAACVFGAMLLYSAQAVAGATEGLYLCANVIAPTLLPFFVLSNLLCALGLPGYLGRWAEGPLRVLFGVGGAGASAFILGLSGGYPLGAASVAQLYRSGAISKEEGQRLLLFCNNSGPAFIMGMAGIGVFHSPSVGVLLYAVHVLAAALAGMSLCRGGGERKKAPSAVCALDFSAAVTDAMARAVKSTAMISGFVIFFSMLGALMRESGLFSLLSGFLCQHTPLSPGQSQSAILGLLELGSGIASLAGMAPTPGNLALCAFILGWGGLSVQFQTAAVLAPAGLKCGPGVLAKLLHGALSAVLTYGLGSCLL